jgi:uncharacterized protein DUF4129
LWVLVGVLAAPARADARVERARASVLDERYQKNLPNHATAEGSATERDGQPRRQDEITPDDARDTRREQADHNGPMQGLFTFLLWAVVIVTGGLIVIWLASELLRYGGSDAQLAAEPSGEPGGVDLAVIQRPLGDAEVLAARGDYREAIHALLLRTLQELVRSSAVRVPPALTSREILGRVPLADDPREALAGLITAVEITHFGGDAATQDDYVRCRAQFQRFARAFVKA